MGTEKRSIALDHAFGFTEPADCVASHSLSRLRPLSPPPGKTDPRSAVIVVSLACLHYNRMIIAL